MKKFLSFVFIMFAAAFVANAEVRIQGVPVSGVVAQSVSRQMNGLAVANEVNVSNLPQGTYIVNVESPQGQKIEKVVKM